MRWIQYAVIGLWICVALGPIPGCRQNEPKNEVSAPKPEQAAKPKQEAKQADGDEKQASSLPSATNPPPKLLTEDQIREGWISLFDGQTVFGWRGGPSWRVEHGELVSPKGEDERIRTATRFGDLILHLEFQGAPETMADVRLAAPLKDAYAARNCYQVTLVAARGDDPPGSLVPRESAPATDIGSDWHAVDVRVEGAHVEVKFDGRSVVDYTDANPPGRGYIILQTAGNSIRFRNIRLKPLGLQNLFNGKDLTGWKTYPEMPSVFSVTKEGYLNVKNGRGQLETEKKFGDFVLQLECISHAKGLNSGIFFRCIPGEQMNGYESQIHNLFKDDDRTQPVDCGTGGIFRRVNARYVNADDLKWFCKTIIADGPHIAVWVNGYQVTDWTDTRQENPNPRRGLRLQPGTIMIRGHDPTTNLSFRNLRAAELPARNAGKK